VQLNSSLLRVEDGVPEAPFWRRMLPYRASLRGQPEEVLAGQSGLQVVIVGEEAAHSRQYVSASERTA
jgi:hypothetical protein